MGETDVERRRPVAVIVMGPSGIGKSTTAERLAHKLGWIFEEGDALHPPANIAKMVSGVPLDDDDRDPWLLAIRDWISGQADSGRGVVVTCSALKRSYRDILRDARARVLFLELVADDALLAQRLSERTGHFMPASLLGSQLATLESLDPDEPGATVIVDAPPEIVLARALAGLGLGEEDEGRAVAQ